ncbi:MAG: extracellular solute-binding protein [Microthrixaceae bacterium]
MNPANPQHTIRRRGTRPTRLIGALAAVTTMIAGACGGGDSSDRAGTTSAFAVDADCTRIDMAVSSEKIDLLTDLAKTFNAANHKVDGHKVCVVPVSKASGGAMSALAKGWDTAADGPKPVVWSPASRAWGAVLNQRLTAKGDKAMAPDDAKNFMLTPLVIAMPKPMAQALGYPQTPIGWADIARLATAADGGWAAHGHPEWGPFRLGKTNPNFSTSGLSALIAQTYAAANKQTDLTAEDLGNPAVADFSRRIESAVVHYGDITMTFLNNWFKADRRGTSLTYASAVAVEEKSVIDYNSGNPDGVLSPGERPRPPKVPLTAIYPSEGTLYSDSPFYILDADWVSPTERKGAALFADFVSTPDVQRRVLRYGFRPAIPQVAVGAPVVTKNGVDPDQPKSVLSVPSPAVTDGLLKFWADNRKRARVMMVIDVSGSMAESADGTDGGDSKLELAKRAAISSLGEFSPDDEVGLRIFTTGLGSGDAEFEDLQPIAPIGPNRERLANSIRNLIPRNGTPLYSVAQQSFDDMARGYDPSRINAVILLTDGANDDGDDRDDARQLSTLLTELRSTATGEDAKPIRLFTVAYGASAQSEILSRMAEASAGAAYAAKDATTIEKVFSEVVSNF